MCSFGIGLQTSLLASGNTLWIINYFFFCHVIIPMHCHTVMKNTRNVLFLLGAMFSRQFVAWGVMWFDDCFHLALLCILSYVLIYIFQYTNFNLDCFCRHLSVLYVTQDHRKERRCTLDFDTLQVLFNWVFIICTRNMHTHSMMKLKLLPHKFLA
jgi:hypothetical protein